MLVVIAGRFVPSKQITALKRSLSNGTNTKDKTIHEKVLKVLLKENGRNRRG